MRIPCLKAMLLLVNGSVRFTVSSFLLISGFIFFTFSGVSAGYAAGRFSELFIESKGQVKDEKGNSTDNVLFYSQGKQLQLFITTSGYSVVTTETQAEKTVYHKIDFKLHHASLSHEQVNFPKGKSPALNFYHAGNVLENVRTATTVLIRNIYPGIDWVWTFDENKNPKHEFMVNIGADASLIKYSVSGANVRLSGNNNIIYSNERLSLQEGPVVLQYQQEEFAGNVSLRGNHVSFNIPQRLNGGGFTIDPPLQLLWGALLDTLKTSFKGITPDSSYNTITVGYSSDYSVPTFPQVTGSYSVFPSRNRDLVIMKTDVNQNLTWATFFGGSAHDEANAVTAAPSGIFITGYSASWDFPQAVYGDYTEPVQLFGSDAFIAKFDNQGKWLWSTGYGGANPDEGLDIKYRDGKIYLAGYTQSSDFPTLQKPGAYFYQDTTLAQNDAFLLEFDTAGNRLWATCFGGSGDDYFTSLFADASGIYTTGYSELVSGNSIPLQSLDSAYFQTTYQGAESFLTRFSMAGTLEWSTYFGGAANDYATSIVRNSCGLFICGTTDGNGLPVQFQPNGNYFQPAYGGGLSDGFIAKFSPDSLQNLYCSYYGSPGEDVLTKMASDTNCNTIFTGYTNGDIRSVGSPFNYFIQDSLKGGYDGLMVAMDSNQFPFWTTYFGSTGNDFGYNLWFPHPFLIDMVGEGFYNYGKDTIGGTYVNPACTDIKFCSHVTSNGVSNRFLQVDSFYLIPGYPFPGLGGGLPPGCDRILQFQALIPLQNSCPNQCNGIAEIDTANIGGCPPYQFLWSSGGTALADSNLCEFYWARVIDGYGQNRTLYGRFDIFRVASSAPAHSYCSTAPILWDSLITMLGGGPPYTITYRGVSTDSCPNTAFFDLTDTAGCIISHSLPWFQYNLDMEIYLQQNGSCALEAELVFPPGTCPNIPDIAIIVIYDEVDSFFIPLQNPFPGLNSELTYQLNLALIPGRHYSGYVELPNCQVPVNGFYYLDVIQDSVSKTLACQNPFGSIDITVFADTAAIADTITYDVYIRVTGDSTGTNVITNLTFTDSSSQTYNFTNLPADNYQVSIYYPDACDTIKHTVDLRTVDFQFNSPNLFCGNSDTLTATLTGGFPPFSFQWSPSAPDTSFIAVSDSGAYSLTITDDEGCVISRSIYISGSAELQIDLVDENLEPCVPGLTSSATVYTSGGTPPVFHIWSNNESSQTATNLPQGTNWVRVFDQSGCEATDTFQNTKQLPFSITDSLENASCFGFEDASVALSISSGYPSYDVQWSSGDSGSFIDNLATGTYEFTVTDVEGCIDSGSVTLTEPDSIFYFATVSPASCNDDDGAATITIVNSGNFTITWTTDSSTNITRNDLSAGIHEFIITNSDNGCTQPGLVNIDQEDSLYIYNLVTNSSSCSATDGYASFSVSGGTQPYLANWSDSGTGFSRNDLNAGTHSFTVTDANGCQLEDSVTITQDNPMTVDLIVNNITCYGETDGSASVSAINALTPITYSWSTGSQQTSITNLPEGVYYATVTDSRSCVVIEQFQIIEPDSFIAVADTGIGIQCNGGLAQVLITGSGGTQPYNDFNVLAGAGTHTEVITDFSGCPAAVTFSLSEPEPIVSNVTVVQPTCDTTGTITIDASGGGGPPYQAWYDSVDLGIFNSTITVAAIPGNNPVLVADSKGCEVNLTAAVNTSVLPEGIVTVRNPLCDGDTSGSVHIDMNPGASPFTINGISFADTIRFDSLFIGSYSYIVTDAAGCINTINFSLSQAAPISISYAMLRDINCYGDSALLYFSASGGASPYSGDDSIKFPAGSFSHFITDSNGCIASVAFSLTQPGSLTGNVSVVQPGCDTSGLVTIFASGGTIPYQAWYDSVDLGIFSSGVTSAPVTGNKPIRIADSRGCEVNLSAQVNNIVQPVGFGASSNLLCNGELGSAQIIMTQGAGPFTTQNISFTDTLDLQNLFAGNYSYVVTDAVGCDDTISFAISQPPPLIANFTILQDFICNDDSVLVVFYGTGGTPPYSGDGTHWFSGGTFIHTITDGNGCTADTGLTLTPPPFTVDTFITPPDCNNSTGSVILDANGGIGPYTVYVGKNLVTFSDTTTLTLFSGNYTYTVTDSLGCSQNISFTLSPIMVVEGIIQTQPTGCNVDSTGSVMIVMQQGAPPYVVNGISFSDTITFSNLPIGFYEYTITDANNCATDLSAVITQPSTLVIDSLNLLSGITCVGRTDAVVEVIARGGTPAYTYVLITSQDDSISQSGNVFTDLGPGSYTIRVFDASGCMAVAAITIDDFIPANHRLEQDSISCYGENDGAIKIYSEPADRNPFMYSLNGSAPQLYNVFYDLEAGNYQIIIADKNDCFDTLTTALTQPDSIDTRVWLNGELLPVDSLNMDEGEFADFTKQNQHPWEIEFSPDEELLVYTDSLIRVQLHENLTFIVRVYLDSLHLDCFAEYTGSIEVRDVPDLPNLITPNGDGFNDTWQVDLEKYPNPGIIIFDRWGAIIYESDDYSNNWDGSYDGEHFADGTYFYLMTVAAHGGKVYKGNINVLNSSR